MQFTTFFLLNFHSALFGVYFGIYSTNNVFIMRCPIAFNITANCCCKTADIRILTMINSLFVSSYYYKTISLIYHKERTTPDIKMENIQHHRSVFVCNL